MPTPLEEAWLKKQQEEQRKSLGGLTVYTPEDEPNFIGQGAEALANFFDILSSQPETTQDIEHSDPWWSKPDKYQVAFERNTEKPELNERARLIGYMTPGVSEGLLASDINDMVQAGEEVPWWLWGIAGASALGAVPPGMRKLSRVLHNPTNKVYVWENGRYVRKPGLDYKNEIPTHWTEAPQIYKDSSGKTVVSQDQVDYLPGSLDWGGMEAGKFRPAAKVPEDQLRPPGGDVYIGGPKATPSARVPGLGSPPETSGATPLEKAIIEAPPGTVAPAKPNVEVTPGTTPVAKPLEGEILPPEPKPGAPAKVPEEIDEAGAPVTPAAEPVVEPVAQPVPEPAAEPAGIEGKGRTWLGPKVKPLVKQEPAASESTALVPTGSRLAAGEPPATPGLDMSDAARMARAKEQGFTIDAFHGTKTKGIQVFDKSKGGSNAQPTGGGKRTGGQKDAFWFSSEVGSRQVGDSAAAYGDVIMPVKLRMTKPLEVHGVGSWDDAAGAARDRKWLVNEYGPKLGNALADGDMDTVIRLARENGHDGLIIRHGKDPTEYAVFDNTNIRHKDAAFDPARTNSSNIYYSNPSPALEDAMMGARAKGSGDVLPNPGMTEGGYRRTPGETVLPQEAVTQGGWQRPRADLPPPGTVEGGWQRPPMTPEVPTGGLVPISRERILGSAPPLRLAEDGSLVSPGTSQFGLEFTGAAPLVKGATSPNSTRGRIASQIVGREDDLMKLPASQRGTALGFDEEVFYHYTPKKPSGEHGLPFDEFDRSGEGLGVHVGTEKAATDRAKAKGTNAGTLQPVRIRKDRVVEIPDLNGWHPHDVLASLRDAGAITEAEMNAILKAHPLPPFWKMSNKNIQKWYHETNGATNALLRKKGYDAIKYKNKYEGKGTGLLSGLARKKDYSYIVLDPRDLRSPEAKFDPRRLDSGYLLAMAPQNSPALEEAMMARGVA